MEQLEAPPELQFPHPKCMFYQHGNRELIILAPDYNDKTNGACYQYLIDTNRWIYLTTYPNGTNPAYHAAAIDQENHLLYITHGRSRIFLTYNFNTNQWNQLDITMVTYGPKICYGKTVCVDSSFHILGEDSCHHLFDKRIQSRPTFTVASVDGIEKHCFLKFNEFVFVKSKDMLLSLGGWYERRKNATDRIWMYHLSEFRKRKWMDFYRTRLPHKGHTVNAVVAFDTVLIVHYADDIGRQHMYFLDFEALEIDDLLISGYCRLHIGMQHQTPMDVIDLCSAFGPFPKHAWFDPILSRSEYQMRVDSLVITKSNYLHLIQTSPPNHARVHLSKFLPAKVYNKYSQQH